MTTPDISTCVPTTRQQVEDPANSNPTVVPLIYHIYHVGQEKRPRNYSLHTLKDAHTTILTPVKKPKKKKKKKRFFQFRKSAPVVESFEKVSSPSGEEESKSLTLVDVDPLSHTGECSNISSSPPVPLKGLKKQQLLDNPQHDPRSNTPSSYFLHQPKLVFHAPPYTFRRNGTKDGPVVCLIHPASFWRGWKLEFGDVLSQEGVIDERGVVNCKFGGVDKKDRKAGYLKGYKLPKKRKWGESGKKFWFEQKDAGFKDNDRAGEMKMKPDEVVVTKWRWFWGGTVREYGFKWRGYNFLWKGTGKAEGVRKAAKMFVWAGHLKLVVLLPAIMEKENGMTARELCLARYTCTLGNRKAGRLEVLEDNLNLFLADRFFPTPSREISSIEPTREDKTAVQLEISNLGCRKTDGNERVASSNRLQDVVIATALSMIINERSKRRFVLELLQQVGEYASG